MASSSLSSASLCSNHNRFEVFLSFRGEDTRDSFTDHLYAALKRAGIRTFRDNDEIDRGQDLGPEIVKAIKESKASVVVLSENFADSTWCLDELLLILEQKRDFNHFVLPVFYHVDPSHVRNQRQSFTIEAKDGVEGSKWTHDKVKQWKAGLTEVANLTGTTVSGSETKIITEIIDTLDRKLDLKILGTPANLIGIETRAESINFWLNDEQSGANILVICGMGGIGKTTLAQYLSNLNKQNFESSSFLEEIGEHAKKLDGLCGIQKQLLKDILDGKNERISSVSEGTTKIVEALQRKRVIVVLDDIDEQNRLEALLGTKAFHTQSKIIITTRLLDIEGWLEKLSWRYELYKLDFLNDQESVALLSYHAFGTKIPMVGFEELVVKLGQYCGGNPLALKVLGSSLFVSAKDRQRSDNILAIWKSRLNSLNSLEGDFDRDIQVILHRSFDSLPHHYERELFLHIACFFVGEDVDYVVEILEHDLFAKAGIKTLINRCLLSVSPSNQLMMHQLLQAMGRNIVQSTHRANRTRVWNDDESYHLLRDGKGSNVIEGLALDIRKLKEGTLPSALKTGSLVKMKKLKLLQLNYVELIGSYKDLSELRELRWLCWHGCGFKTIPSSVLVSSLVVIDMREGNLKKFNPPADLKLLKILLLMGSHNLVSISNLSRLPNLEILILSDCLSLTHVSKTIEDLKSLVTLDLTGCKKLWKESWNKKYVNQLERLKALRSGGGSPKQPLFSLPCSLKSLHLDYCDLKCNNDIRVGFHAKSFFCMFLRGNLFEFLPDNIDLKMLRVLDMNSCSNLKSLLCLPSTLEELYVYSCTSLEKITFQSACFKLRKFGYGGCIRLFDVQGLFKLVSVAELDEADLGHMQWIKSFQHYTVNLVGDEITEGRVWHIQMLYEYGIRSTFLQGIKDQPTNTAPFRSISFCVPKRRIRGLNVTSIYRSSSEDEAENLLILFLKISNTTKGLTWVYNPMVYCKPKNDEDVVWLSYWPIGNLFEAGDKVGVDIIGWNGVIGSSLGVSAVYMDSEVEKDSLENHTMKDEEVIGGDLSEFKVTTGGYYLCRRDIFKPRETSDGLKLLFGDKLDYTDPQGWKKARLPLQSMEASFREQKIFRDSLLKVIFLGDFSSETNIRKIREAVYKLNDVIYVTICIEIETSRPNLMVIGHIDPVVVATRVAEFEKMVKILRVEYKVGILKQVLDGFRNNVILCRAIEALIILNIFMFMFICISLLHKAQTWLST